MLKSTPSEQTGDAVQHAGFICYQGDDSVVQIVHWTIFSGAGSSSISWTDSPAGIMG